MSVSTSNNEVLKGFLNSVNDSQLVLLRSNKVLTATLPAIDLLPIAAENIKSCTIKRKNSGVRGALTGLCIGAATGLILGLISGDDDPDQWFAMTAGEKAGVSRIFLGTGGGIIGLVVGLVPKKITISGKKEKFRDMQAELMIKLAQK